MRYLFRDMHENISNTQINTLVHQFDFNRNGRISFEEFEEIPKDLPDKSPERQQAAIKRRACTMLLLGTALILLFSNPIMAMINKVAVRVDIPPFYVSFVVLPVISNAMEIILTQFYARKKTRKSITISLSALQGSAVMNNTKVCHCLL